MHLKSFFRRSSCDNLYQGSSLHGCYWIIVKSCSPETGNSWKRPNRRLWSMGWFNFASRLSCYIYRGVGFGYSTSKAVSIISLSAFSFNLPTPFLGWRKYKSLWLYAEVLPILRNSSNISSANHGCFTGNFRGL